MKIKDLVKYGIPEEIVVKLEESFGPALLPIQVQAIREYGILDGKSLIINGPTSSGKTLAAELAILKSALRLSPSIYLLPLKALAGEVFTAWKLRYAGFGLRIYLSTHDHNHDDAEIVAGGFDIAVMIYEKFQSLLFHHPEVFQSLGTIVLDEIQMLIDSRRGRVLELILTEYQHLPEKPQLIGLSSALTPENPITAWMEIPFYRSDYRPRELRLGVFFEGRFRYRNLQSFIEDYEEFEAETPEQLAVRLADNGGQTIIFLPTRKETINSAVILADKSDYRAAASVLNGMSRFEQNAALKMLNNTLKRGIAFHNADFTSDERWVIEQGFRLGEIRILCATSTLALGINLPAQNVILDLNLLTGKRFPKQQERKPLSRRQFENMGGRAARGGRPDAGTFVEDEFGRAILFARSRQELEVLWETYVSGLELSGNAPGTFKLTPKACLQVLCLHPESSAEDILAWIHSSFTYKNRSREDNG